MKEHSPNNHHTNPHPEEERTTLQQAYEALLAERLGELDADEREALHVYCARLTEPPTPGEEIDLVTRFTADYWGTFNSVQEFVDNWAYDMEPLESVQSLLRDQSRPEAELNLAEMALVAHLAGDIEFVFTGGKVLVFTKEEA